MGRVRESLLRFDEDLVDVTPDPVFARLERLDEWMMLLFEMCCGVLVDRRIATADEATTETETQMDPRVAESKAGGAAGWRLRVDFGDLIDVGALSHVRSS
jgi:hypothetical protein